MPDVSSAVTYTSVYTDSEPWRYYGEESAEAGSPGVIVYGYDGLPMQPVAPPSPDYVLGPEHPPSPDYVPGPEHPPSPVEIPYIPEPEYPEYLAPSNDEAPLEDQPIPADASPTAASPGYVVDSDPEEDPEDDHADYPTDGGDGDDEPSDDDDDGEDTDDEDKEPFEDEEDDEEEEEHLAPADSSAIPIIDLVLLAGDTEALEADEPTLTPRSPYTIIPLSQTRLRRPQKTVRLKPSMLASMKACIARHAALLLPPLPVPSLPLPLPSSLTTSPTDTGAPLGYRAAEIRMRSLLLSTSRRTDIPEVDVPPRKRACLTTLVPGFKVGESSAAGAARQPGPTESDLRRYSVEQTALSPGYVVDYDPEKDEKDPKEDPADYPADRGNNDDDESSNDDDDDDDNVEKDEEDKEEEEHLAPTDPSNETMTTVNQGMSVEEIERGVAQRVANVIKAIAIYETKTNIARKSMSQTK
nr:hypothetical protein [Tanacetum cinerariifolium]